MTVHRRSDAFAGLRATPATRLSGRVLGQLGAGQQFVLWAMRRRLQAELAGTGAEGLAAGFVHVFGIARGEAALSAFEALFDILARAAVRTLELCPPGCACVSIDEEHLLELVHPTGQPGGLGGQGRAAAVLVAPHVSDELVARARRFADLLAEADPAAAIRRPAVVRRWLH